MSRVPLTRRSFLFGSAAAGTLLGIGYVSSAPAAESRSPNEKLNIGIIGVGGRGAANMAGVVGENIVALCDVDERHLAKAAEKYPAARKYIDFRKMIDEGKDIDAVVISTTEHTHAPAALRAMRLGKHVYCEKPLAHTVQEARLMRETCISAKVATQHGTQIHAGENYRRVVELVRAGAIGPVREAHVWCDRVGPGGDRPPAQEPPPYLHWDLWLGPAPQRPYSPGYLGGCLAWDKFWDFGNGTLGDMGSHLIDLPFWALELKYPATVEAEGDPPKPHPETNPHWLIARWQHEKRGDGPHQQAVTVIWYDGRKRPPVPRDYDLSKWSIGVVFVGDDGMLVADYSKHVLLPEDKFKDYKRPPRSIPPSPGHYREWIAACRGGPPAQCNFEYAGWLIEHNLLGNVAYRVGKKLQWNATGLKAANAPEADRYIRKEYRPGWEIA